MTRNEAISGESDAPRNAEQQGILTSKALLEVPDDTLVDLSERAHSLPTDVHMSLGAGTVAALCRDLDNTRDCLEIAQRLTVLYRDERNHLVDKNEDLQRRVAAANTAVAAWDDLIRQCREDKAELEMLRELKGQLTADNARLYERTNQAISQADSLQVLASRQVGLHRELEQELFSEVLSVMPDNGGAVHVRALAVVRGLKQREAGLVKALEFYAHPGNWMPTPGMDSEASWEEGDTARKALAALASAQGGEG